MAGPGNSSIVSTILSARLDDPARTTVHLDAVFDQRPARVVLAAVGIGGVIRLKGEQAPVQAGVR